MLSRLIHHPTSPLEVQAFYFIHRSKAALLQQITFAIICYAAGESILRRISKFICDNKDTIVQMARDAVVDIQQKQLNEVVKKQQAGVQVTDPEQIGPVDGDHLLPFAKMVLNNQNQPTDFFGPAVLKEFLVFLGLKSKDDPTTGFKGVMKPLVKDIIIKKFTLTRIYGFAFIGLLDIVTRPFVEDFLSVNTTRTISQLASARPDGISNVCSLSTGVSLNNVIEFQAHVGNYWFGSIFRAFRMLVDPFTAPSSNVQSLTSTDDPASVECKELVQETLFGHMDLGDILVYTAGLELTMLLRRLPLLSSWKTTKTVIKDGIIKKEVPRMIGRWAVFVGATYGLGKVTKYTPYTCSIVGWTLGVMLFPWKFFN